jgi:hypothetical protein
MIFIGGQISLHPAACATPFNYHSPLFNQAWRPFNSGVVEWPDPIIENRPTPGETLVICAP